MSEEQQAVAKKAEKVDPLTQEPPALATVNHQDMAKILRSGHLPGLSLKRRAFERIIIGNAVVITVEKIERQRVILKIVTDPSVKIEREEMWWQNAYALGLAPEDELGDDTP